MEEEAEKLKELQNEVEKQMNMSPPPGNGESAGDPTCGPGSLSGKHGDGDWQKPWEATRSSRSWAGVGGPRPLCFLDFCG